MVYTLTKRATEWRGIRVVAAGAAIFFLTLYFIRMVQFVSDPGPVFRYTDSKRNMPELVAELQASDPDRLFISNDIELVYVLVGRPAHTLPIMFDHYIQRDREDFPVQLALARERLEDGALIVFFGEPDQEEADVIRMLGVEEIKVFPNVRLLGIIES
jgi:hypothetical protein